MTNSNNDQYIVKSLINLHDKLHKIPKKKDIKKEFSHEFISEMLCIFGNYKNAIAECGYDYKAKYTDDDLIYYLISLSKELNRTPNANDMRSNKTYPDVSIIQDRFGSWNNALLAAGIEINKKIYSKDELIDILIQLKKELGRTPNIHDFETNPNLPCYPLFRSKFGSFNDALRKSGLKVNVRDAYTDAELINLIRDFIITNERIPTCSDFDGTDYPYHSIVIKRFGSWTNAIEFSIGFKYVPKSSISDIYLSNHGDIRPSVTDGKIDDMIGLLHINHEHEVPYNNYISNCGNYTFDIVIENKLFIEVAGILTRHQFESKNPGNSKMKIEYLNTLLKKIELCNKNNLNLMIIFYKDKMPIINDNLLKELHDSGININNATTINEGHIVCNRILASNVNPKKHSNEELKNNIICFYIENGRLPYLHEMKKENYPYPIIYTKRQKWSDWLLDVINDLKIEVSEDDLINRRIHSNRLWSYKNN